MRSINSCEKQTNSPSKLICSFNRWKKTKFHFDISTLLILKLVFFNVYLFIFERERERKLEHGGCRERESERENLKQAPHCQHRAPMQGLISWTTRSWPEPKPRVGHLTHWATQASLKLIFSILITSQFNPVQLNHIKILSPP